MPDASTSAQLPTARQPAKEQQQQQQQQQEAQAARLLTLVAYVKHPAGSFLLCQTCSIAIPTALLAFHFSSTRTHNYRKKDCARLLAAWEALYSSSCPVAIQTEADAAAWELRNIRQLPQPLAPIPELPIHYALQCTLTDPATGKRCEYLDAHSRRMRAHCYITHGWGEEPKQGVVITLKEGDRLPWEEEVPCQRLRNNGKACRLWRVSLPAKGDAHSAAPLPAATLPTRCQTWADLETRLDKGQAKKAVFQAAASGRYPIHVSPWVEKTGWAAYLQGQNLRTVARLLHPPAASEPGLAVLHSAFDALIESARTAVLEEDSINTFTLHRVNSFKRGQSFKRPLLTKLLDGTYRKYKAVWRKLLSFVYRLTVLRQQPNLHYILTPQQQQALANLPATITAASVPARSPLQPTQPNVEPTTPTCSAKSACSAYSGRSAAPSPAHSPIYLRSRRQRQPPQVQTPGPSSLASFSDDDDGSGDDLGSEYSPALPSSPGRDTYPADPPPLSPLSLPLQETSESTAEPCQDATQLDQAACLELCIALLDHRIEGKLTDSIMVGFLAANGINKECNGFEEPATATSPLSALVKMAQLLVLQQTLHEHRSGQVAYPSEKVAELQDRFMVYGSHSPINWILNLRAYGAAIRNSTTAAGWIEWSDDGQTLTYKALELTLNGLRWSLRDLVAEAQGQLNQLLLLPDSEADTRARLVPAISLAQLKDDPGIFAADHSFLLDARNKATLSEGSRRYILSRIRDSPKLRKRFFLCEDTLTWNPAAIQSYTRLTYLFLERLLLLTHMTGGQPARGTELLTLRWRNSSHSDIRSIFIDNGMLSFVTSYHKNYSTSSTTRIIQRYLPPEIGELMLYYLWLVTPFLDALHILTEGQAWQAPNIGSYLWPDSLAAAAKSRKKRIASDVHNEEEARSKQASVTDSLAHHRWKQSTNSVEQPWPSTHLGHVIKTVLAAALSTTITILLWRHAAIAMSRKHLPEGFRFKRDYGLNEGDAIMDLQSTHSSHRAAISYARSRDEGPGFSKMIRDDYRSLSRAWHTFLGFGAALPPRDSTEALLQASVEVHHELTGTKRKRAELEQELRQWVSNDQLLRTKRARRTGTRPAATSSRYERAQSDWEF